MKLSEAREGYYDHSAKASEVSRSLAFAAIAVIWLFKAGDGMSSKIPENLVLPLTLFVYALACDLLQYVTATLAWGIFHRRNEVRHRGGSVDPDVLAPRFINWPAITFFWLKLGLVIAGYFVLLRFLSKQLLQ